MCYASFNNTIVTFTDVSGETLCWDSAGTVGFKGARKATPFAATRAAERAASKAKRMGVREVEVQHQGPWFRGVRLRSRDLDHAGLSITCGRGPHSYSAQRMPFPQAATSLIRGIHRDTKAGDVPSRPDLETEGGSPLQGGSDSVEKPGQADAEADEDHRMGSGNMHIRWRGLELPARVDQDAGSRTETFGRFVVEPFERGFGTTIGNSLRRILLSSIEGAAITSISIKGVEHEFTTMPGVMEDVTDLILNLKGVVVSLDGEVNEARTMRLSASGPGEVTADLIEADPSITIHNPQHVIATLTTMSHLRLN